MTSQDNLRLDKDQMEAARAEVGPVLVEGAPGSVKRPSSSHGPSCC